MHRLHRDRKKELRIGFLMPSRVPELERRKRGKAYHWSCPECEKGISQELAKEHPVYAVRLARRRHLRSVHNYSTKQLMQEAAKHLPRTIAVRTSRHAVYASALARNWHRMREAGHKLPRYYIRPIVQPRHRNGERVRIGK